MTKGDGNEEVTSSHYLWQPFQVVREHKIRTACTLTWHEYIRNLETKSISVVTSCPPKDVVISRRCFNKHYLEMFTDEKRSECWNYCFCSSNTHICGVIPFSIVSLRELPLGGPKQRPSWWIDPCKGFHLSNFIFRFFTLLNMLSCGKLTTSVAEPQSTLWRWQHIQHKPSRKCSFPCQTSLFPSSKFQWISRYYPLPSHQWNQLLLKAAKRYICRYCLCCFI